MTPSCSVPECDRPATSRGWCHTHYMRWYQSGIEPSGPIVTKRSTPDPCAVDGCSRTARDGDLCGPHGKRARRNSGDPGAPGVRDQQGAGNGRTRYSVSSGYVFVKAPLGHPNAYRNGRIQEHTLVMSEILGRALLPGENVHHKNADKTDNRPQNLELWVSHQPKGARAADLVAWAREILDRYGDLDPKVIS